MLIWHDTLNFFTRGSSKMDATLKDTFKFKRERKCNKDQQYFAHSLWGVQVVGEAYENKPKTECNDRAHSQGSPSQLVVLLDQVLVNQINEIDEQDDLRWERW